MRYVVIAILVLLAAAVLIVLNHYVGGSLNPSGGVVGGACPTGTEQCRRVAVIEATPSPSLPVFRETDFDGFGKWRLGSDHVVLPGCTDMGYYAYAQPSAEGPLQTFQVAGRPDQSHALTAQAGSVDFGGVDHAVLVSANLLECGLFENQTVRVVNQP